MPLQNRVDPFGTLFPTVERGLMMGNRGGRFHDSETKALRPKHWVSKQWICCEIAFRGRQRNVWGRSYTELFFSNEISALAAGHRPCFECRREDALAFAKAWGKATNAMPPKAAVMDTILHEQRVVGRQKRVHNIHINNLPDGTIILIHDKPHVLQQDRAVAWQFSGKGATVCRPKSGIVPVLTPPAIVACLAHGYKPR